MKNLPRLRERTCTKKDHSFVYGMTKKLLFPYIPHHSKVSKADFDAEFLRKYREIKILLKGKSRIGFYHISPDIYDKTALYVSRIFVSPRYQKQRIGYFLMKNFEDLGYKKIRLQVWKNNPAAAFYKRLGYKVLKDNKGKCLMEKKL
jgi:ribosomal protein S18 acetylase RimI-like enzyme